MAGEKRSGGKLSRTAILKTALEILDREGIDALSMRSLGRELHVEAMSLYNHIGGKEELLDGIVEAILTEVETFPPSSDWKADLKKGAYAYRDTLFRHPHALPVLATRPVTTAIGLEEVEAILFLLNQGGISGLPALYFLNNLFAYIIGHALLVAGITPGTETPAPSLASKNSVVSDGLPLVLSLLDEMKERSFDVEFAQGLDAMLRQVSI